ncbi:MAG: 50S ribosomal protein L11 methyltransferase [Lachnospiraceae bacterium]|nr:50S ribosomal protein L11 methyltransferase [Lachnospiraceae bacterium]
MEWKKFTLETTTEAVDLVGEVLMENGITGFELEDNRGLSQKDKEAMFIDILPEMSDDGKARIIFYMDMDTPEDEEKETLSNIMKGIDELKDFVDVGDVKIMDSITREQDWVNKWKEFFKPFTVDDILIRPTWEKVDNENDYKMVIKIDPGTAFGTGLHETTQLCIRQLRKYLKGGETILDAGCGSGILSIVGKKMGAGYTLGVDIDERAVDASCENVKENSVDENIEFITGNIIGEDEIKDRVGYDKYDIVVANILADVIVPLSEVIAPHMKKGGLFITSGIINTKEQDVVDAINSNSELEIEEITRQNDWVNVTARKV